ncbi:hypothetical protein LXL04_039503 [Taraxacum kok-saghyz]
MPGPIVEDIQSEKEVQRAATVFGVGGLGCLLIHMRFFVLESRLLAYYKRQPQDNMVPIKTLVIDGNCRAEDRGLKTQQGLMAAFNIQEALIWKEKIESVIDQHQESLTARYIVFI